MSNGYLSMDYPGEYIAHYGIKGQQWGIRRFQNEDGSLTPEGKQRYGKNFDAKKLDDMSVGKFRYKWNARLNTAHRNAFDSHYDKKMQKLEAKHDRLEAAGKSTEANENAQAKVIRSKSAVDAYIDKRDEFTNRRTAAQWKHDVLEEWGIVAGSAAIGALESSSLIANNYGAYSAALGIATGLNLAAYASLVRREITMKPGTFSARINQVIGAGKNMTSLNDAKAQIKAKYAETGPKTVSAGSGSKVTFGTNSDGTQSVQLELSESDKKKMQGMSQEQRDAYKNDLIKDARASR